MRDVSQEEDHTVNVRSDPQGASFTIAATKPNERELILHILERLFATLKNLDLTTSMGSMEDTSVIGFRATASDLASLIVATIDAAVGEADAQRVTVVGIDVTNVMPTDDEGFRCWGYLETVERQMPLSDVVVSEPVTIMRDEMGVTCALAIRISGVGE